ncbi:MAG: hypothetical protein Q9207_001457 [Kuettlingeria erythrocarpa]
MATVKEEDTTSHAQLLSSELNRDSPLKLFEECLIIGHNKLVRGSTDNEFRYQASDMTQNLTAKLLDPNLPPRTIVTSLNPLQTYIDPAYAGQAQRYDMDEDVEMATEAAGDVDEDGEVNDTGSWASEPQDVEITAASSRLPDFDFLAVVPDEVLEQKLDQPYQDSWVDELEVEHDIITDFDRKYVSRYKVNNCFMKGALKIGDVFCVKVIAASGSKKKRLVEVIGLDKKGTIPHCPRICMAQSATRVCAGPNDVIDNVLKYFRDREACKPGWLGVSVYRDHEKLGSLYHVRMRLALWEGIMDEYTAKKGLPNQRKRRADPKTGEFILHPALSVRK